MKKYLDLISVLTLAACAGGSGGGGNSLSPAEQLFGSGMGTGATPTNLISRPDGVGSEILSFGAWGNVYDLKKTSDNVELTGWHTSYSPGVYLSVSSGSEVYDFTGQQKLEIAQWTYPKDASVSNATFTGPAIMYQGIPNVWHVTNGSDYGTMKLTFGYDIDSPARLEFVMSNPENNLVVDQFNFSGTANFSEDRNNVYLYYYHDTQNSYQGGNYYKGYGHRN